MSNPFIFGDKELIAKLQNLRKSELKKAIRKATREVCKKIQGKAKSAMPTVTGNSKRQLRVRSLKRSRKYTGTRVTIGEDNGKFYWSFVEWGHRVGKRTGSNAHRRGAANRGVNAERRFIPGRWILKQVADSNADAALHECIDLIGAEVMKAMTKGA
ncbi:MAG: HK97 gp10 family phage protein [Burkholderiales bacterium]|nr:HK97 gp10 family phage protein [Burkholderiales bacterium]